MQPERRFVWRGEADATSADAAASPDLRRGPGRPACRILVVDDDVLVRAQLCALLHTSGYEVETAACGDDALELLRASPCDIVVTDWQMPRMDGVALCRQLRATEHHAYVFLLMLTIRQSPQELLAGFAAGVDDYVVKGTSNEELLARLEKGRRIARWRSTCKSTDGGIGELSMIDSPTGTYNLVYLMRHLPRELARSQRHGHWLALLSCELDGISRSNEVLGHEIGEDLARHFAAVSSARLRGTDWITRTSRREFMVILPETDRAGAQCVARKVSEAFAHREPGIVKRLPAGGVRIHVTTFAPEDKLDGAAKIQALLREAESLQNGPRPADTPGSQTDSMHYLSDFGAEEVKSGRDWPASR